MTYLFSNFQAASGASHICDRRNKRSGCELAHPGRFSAQVGLIESGGVYMYV